MKENLGWVRRYIGGGISVLVILFILNFHLELYEFFLLGVLFLIGSYTVNPKLREKIDVLSFSDLSFVLQVLGLKIVLSIAFLMYIWILGHNISIHVEYRTMGVDLVKMLVIVMPVIVLFEEVLFRHYIQKGLFYSLGMKGRVFITSIIFGAAHIPAYGLEISGIIALAFVTFDSIIYGFTYEVTDNLCSSVFLHSAVNISVIIAVFFLPSKYLFILG